MYYSGWLQEKITALPFSRDKESLLEPVPDGGVQARFKANTVQGFLQSEQPQLVLLTNNNDVFVQVKGIARGNGLKGLRKNNGGDKQG